MVQCIEQSLNSLMKKADAFRPYSPPVVRTSCSIFKSREILLLYCKVKMKTWKSEIMMEEMSKVLVIV